MLETLLVLFCLGAVGSAIGKGKQLSREAKEAAIRSGSPTYFDAKGKRRSVWTDELVIPNRMDNTVIGAFSNTVYINSETDWVNKRNEELSRTNPYVYWGKCKTYWKNNKEKHYRLREKETGRMFDIISTVAPGKYSDDTSKFVICYVDENLNSTHEYKHVPIELFYCYRGFDDIRTR